MGKLQLGEKVWLIAGCIIAFAVVLSYQASGNFSTVYEIPVDEPNVPVRPALAHLPTPKQVKALYMSQCVAGTPSIRSRLVKLVEDTELNSIVIDLKDYSGRISFESETPILANKTSKECYIDDLKDFVSELHDKDIYVIGRITVFQDPFMAKEKPEWAVKTESDKNVVWKDRKGISYIDPGSKGMWDYIIILSREAYFDLGFDELNFDYIRFPSDGNMTDIYFPESDLVVKADPINGKSSVLNDFFAYLSVDMKNSNIPISADLFGMTTTNTDDLNIGQILEHALVHFDYVAPMIYPSHYPPGFIGLKNPAAYPYEVIKYSMDKAMQRASTTPGKLRPWLQDFNLGAVYTPEMVRLQIKAVYDSGADSWMLWNAGNRYTEAALEK